MDGAINDLTFTLIMILLYNVFCGNKKMSFNLYNEYYESQLEYAERVYQVFIDEPVYKLNYDTKNHECGIEYFDTSNKILIKKKRSAFSKPGLYLLYQGNPLYFKPSNSVSDKLYANRLYWGTSNSDSDQRLYRFIKEGLNLSRSDEKHPAGKKARNLGIDLTNIYIRFLTEKKYPKKYSNTIWNNNDNLDEYLTSLYPTLFNKRIFLSRKVKRA